MGITQTAVYDDGKGRSPDKRKEPDHELKRVEYAQEPGEYSFHDNCEIESLVLSCPFCGTVCPVPYLIKTISKEPLTLDEPLSCVICEERFHIVDGKVFKVWPSPQL